MSTRSVKINSEIGQNEPKTAKMSRARGKGRLLVVDGDPGMNSLLVDVLCGAGHTVLSYADAIVAFRLLASREEKIDVLICEVGMPKFSGTDFLSMIAELDLKIPVILTAEFGTEKTAREAIKNGAFGYLSKPFQLAEVNELVRRALAGK
jgi:DNA-binding NtrC family response regulator